MVNADLGGVCIRFFNGRTYGPVLVASCQPRLRRIHWNPPEAPEKSPITITCHPCHPCHPMSQFWVTFSRPGLELGTHFFSLLVGRGRHRYFINVIHGWVFHVCWIYWWKPFICASFICIYVYLFPISILSLPNMEYIKCVLDVKFTQT